MSNIDTNIDNWSINDIYELFDLTNPTVQEIRTASERLIGNSKTKGSDTITNFIKQARDKAVKIKQNSTIDIPLKEPASEQADDWRKSQFLPNSDKSQSLKTTDRENMVDIFDDGIHYQMKQKRLGITQSYSVPVAQGTINPNQVNVTERIIVIDSQYRQHILPYSANDISLLSFNTNFSVYMADSLSNVLSLELNSVQIPQTWYNISAALGNNAFLYVDATGTYTCVIPDGYYNIPIEWLIDFPVEVLTTGQIVLFKYDITTMKINVSLTVPDTNARILWHSDGNNDNDDSYCSRLKPTFININLGWALGFRTRNVITKDLESTFNTIGVVADATCSLYGPQYLMLCIDDFQHSRLNKGIIGTVDTVDKIDLPTYNDSKNRARDLTGKCAAISTESNKLTQAQIYTINSIDQSRLKKPDRPVVQITPNVFALIPIPSRQTITIFKSGTTESTSYSLPSPIVLNGASLNSNARVYFGPVTIDRLGIKLVDNKGSLVDLNGSEWSFTIKIKQLYQY